MIPSNRTGRLIIRDMIVETGIGVLAEEKTRTQRVSVTVEAELETWPSQDDIADTVSYDLFYRHIKNLTGGAHIELVETLAERIARACLAEKGVASVRVRVEKPDIYPDAVAGVEIFRSKQS